AEDKERTMIRSDAEYREALRRLQTDEEFIASERARFVAAGYSPDEVERGIEPLVTFKAQLEDEVRWYEQVRQRTFPTIRQLTDVGRLLIALRIASGLSQRELAQRLGVSEAMVSRDERNEYHGATIERAQRILDVLLEALEGSFSATVQAPPPTQRE